MSATRNSRSRPVGVVRKAMRAVKSANTAPELALRKALWAEGLRYRLHYAKLPGKPDLVFLSRKVALFIDGDYWHGRQWKQRGFASLEEQMSRVNNPGYWIKKIRGNMERDRRVNRQLAKAGWSVIRVWESDIKKRPASVIKNVIRKISSQMS